jgi:type II secretory pathway pseudopilin PulG
MSTKRSGMTVTGLLVLIAIISVLVGLMLTNTVRVRDGGASSQIINNLKQLSLAVHSYHDVYKQFPPATAPAASVPGSNFSLSLHLLPYIEQQPLYQQYCTGNRVAPTSIPPFQSPLDVSTADWIGVQNFAGNVRVFTDIGVNTKFDQAVTGLDSDNGFCKTTLKDSFPDGTSNTIMFATRFANNGSLSSNGIVNCSSYTALLGVNNSAFFGVQPQDGAVSATSKGGWQAAPSVRQANCEFGAVAHSFGIAGIHVALADASCRRVFPSMTAQTWNQAMQPNDGHELGSDW